MRLGETNWVFRENSLDIIRLLAATQVAVLHSVEYIHAGIADALFFEVLRLFPGVPIFFFISGYLISKSFESSPSLGVYVRSRVLRIFPALVIVVFFNIVLIWSTGYFSELNVSFGDIFTLYLAKVSFFQFYNPDFMRGFGDGVLNGSLWTICVELQFYILVPVLYFLFGRNKQIKNIILILLIIFFMVLNRLLFNLSDEYSSEVWWKIFRVSFAPWFYMFLTGVFIQRNFKKISPYFEKIPFLPLLFLYIVFSYFASQNDVIFSNYISPLVFFLVVLIVFRMAYFIPEFSNKLLKGNDISYGIYIWHMVIVNQFLYYGLKDDWVYVFLIMFVVVLLSVISWCYVEKPSLGYKKFSIKK